MWARDPKGKAAGVLARVLARYASADHVSRAAARMQRWRTLVDDAAGAFWHFTALPSKRDLRTLYRRVSALKRKVAELDLAIAELEAIKQKAEEETGARGVSPRPRDDES